MVEDPHLGTRLKTTTLEWAEVRLALLGTTPLPSKKVCFSDKQNGGKAALVTFFLCVSSIE